MSDESEGKGRTGPADNPEDAVDATADEAVSETSADDEVSLVKPDVSDEESAASLAAEDSDVEPGSGDRESALVGASAAGSARAAARRSGVRAGTTVAKGVATKPRDSTKETRVNIFARLRRFLREVVAELRKVIWPARNQMVTYTIVVIVFVVFMVALTAGLDVLFAKGVLAIFG
ncbi:preprotein translocase subunit SecE [Nakamurella sp. UYEF19]|uniref:preprotein translocase subunit SecE n=1 Tax=Nakamurella sp. UYEF19 TaxID=1756392 RepID=UPI003396ABED